VNNTFLTNNTNSVQIAPSAGNVRSILVRIWLQDNSGFGLLLNPGASVGAGTLLNESTAAVNGTGIGVNGGKLLLGNSVITKNNVGVAVTGGSVLSYKTNMIDANTTDGTPLTDTPLN
jgi:hypothetical protein